MTSVGSSTSTISNLSAKTGIGGLVSGMDIDELVESLSATSRQKIVKQQQYLQKLNWKQTAYRSVTSKLTEFQGKYLDILSSTNIRSEAMFNAVKVASSSDKVKVAATSSATAGSITINSVTQLATQQTAKSNSTVSKALAGKMKSAEAGIMSSEDIDNLLADIGGKSIRLTLDGKVKTLTFDETFVNSVNGNKTSEGLKNAFQTAVDTAFGVTDPDDRILSVEVSNDQLTFSAAAGSKVTVNSVGDDSETLTNLGFAAGQSNKLTLSAPLKDLYFESGLDDVDSYKFSINNVEFSFSKDDSLYTVMSRINSSKAGVTVSYSSITDRFTMTANESGAGNKIDISETDGNLMTAFGLTEEAGVDVTSGVNAILTVNNQEIIRSSNTMDIDGVRVTISEKTTEPTTITMTEDASDLMDTIKGFVENYNTMMDYINGLTKEKIHSDYPPLTDSQKNEMSESQIKDWEEKAKSGILRGDSILRNITSKLHTVMTGLSVGGISLSSIGITSAGYGENGKLKIDETKLMDALKTKGTEIKELFASDKGIGEKLNEIITDATKTSGVKGTRGTLVEVAGVESTLSDTENSIYEQIKRTNKTITTLQARLSSEESRLWSKFTAMETALNNLNIQSSMLMQFSSGE